MGKLIYALLLCSVAGCHTIPPCPEQHRFGAVCHNDETSPLRDETACQAQGGIKEWLCSEVPLHSNN